MFIMAGLDARGLQSKLLITVADSGGGPWVPSPPPFLASYV